jgi:peptidoglycan glycosyltransferase
MTRPLHHLSLVFAGAFFIMALAGGYWVIVQGEALTARADNPRRVLLERRSPRGTIYDRNGAVLAESIGTPGDYTRHYPYPSLAPVLGYVSPFYGSAGIEATFDAILHGDEGLSDWERWSHAWLGTSPTGRAVALTLDLRLQRAADEALGAHTGAAVLLDAASGEILALASHPTFDPNTLDEQWEALVNDQRAPLLNRATLALYQPGGALSPAILAAAFQSQLADADAVLNAATDSLNFNGLTLNCRVPPPSLTLTVVEALRFGCPQPVAELGEQLGARRLEQLFSDLRLLNAPSIGLPTTASAPPDFSAETQALAIGQGRFTITPLHLALVTAALTRNGELPTPQLIRAVQNKDGAWQITTPADHPVAAFSPETAAQMKTLLRGGQRALAFSGAAGGAIAWFSRAAPDDETRFVIAVVLEDGDTDAAAQIGQRVLATAAQAAP